MSFKVSKKRWSFLKLLHYFLLIGYEYIIYKNYFLKNIFCILLIVTYDNWPKLVIWVDWSWESTLVKEIVSFIWLHYPLKSSISFFFLSWNSNKTQFPRSLIHYIKRSKFNRLMTTIILEPKRIQRNVKCHLRWFTIHKSVIRVFILFHYWNLNNLYLINSIIFLYCIKTEGLNLILGKIFI